MIKRCALLAVFSLCGCPTPYTPVPSPYNFDSCGADGGSDLCGFVVESGTVERVPTFTAGEYGLRLDTGAVISVPFSWGDCFDGSIEFLARCDTGGSLHLEDTLHGVLRGTAESRPGPDWQQMHVVLGGGFMPDNSQIPFVKLRIANSGTASCTIDEITIGSSGSYCP